jgi:hypothetical protein
LLHKLHRLDYYIFVMMRWLLFMCHKYLHFCFIFIYYIILCIYILYIYIIFLCFVQYYLNFPNIFYWNVRVLVQYWTDNENKYSNYIYMCAYICIIFTFVSIYYRKQIISFSLPVQSKWMLTRMESVSYRVSIGLDLHWVANSWNLLLKILDMNCIRITFTIREP